MVENKEGVYKTEVTGADGEQATGEAYAGTVKVQSYEVAHARAPIEQSAVVTPL